MKQKIIPKFPRARKKLKSFFTDESGKITKENIFELSIGAMLLTGLIVHGEPPMGHTDFDSHGSSISHSSGAGGHVSSGHANTALAGHANGARNGIVNYQPSGGHMSVGHASGNTHSNSSAHGSGPVHTNVGIPP